MHGYFSACLLSESVTIVKLEVTKSETMFVLLNFSKVHFLFPLFVVLVWTLHACP